MDSTDPVGQQADFDVVSDQAVADDGERAWHFSGHDGTLTTQVPARQGEHNDEILKEIGLAGDEIDALRTTSRSLNPHVRAAEKAV
ncbi:MAG TPA: hypothetical protein VGO77_13020 [Mycobacterium sp.]|nr:hypothetical protein [Mycobacterium sp.]